MDLDLDSDKGIGNKTVTNLKLTTDDKKTLFKNITFNVASSGKKCK